MRGKCRHGQKRAEKRVLVQRDIARLLCTAMCYFNPLAIKRGEPARFIGTRGDPRSRTSRSN
jgi:hypothetical protein